MARKKIKSRKAKKKTKKKAGKKSAKKARKPAAQAKGKRGRLVLGVDIGGTGIKGAPVDLDKGTLAADRHRILTPHPATPKAVAKVVAQLVKHFKWKGPIGCAFPAVIKDGVLYVQAGGGVVADSDPESEFQESCNKAQALIRAAEEAVKFANGN